MNGFLALILIVIIAVAGAAAYYYFFVLKQQPQPKPSPPPNQGGGQQQSQQQQTGQTNQQGQQQSQTGHQQIGEARLKTGKVQLTSDGKTFEAKIVVPKNWNGKCVILVHGMGRDHTVWVAEGVVEELAENGYCVLLFDLPLHGSRGKLKSLKQLPQVILQGSKDIMTAATYLKDHGASEVYVISRSLGSIVTAVALGDGAPIEKAELLLASANFSYLVEYGAIASDPQGKADMKSWVETDVVYQVDPLYKLPNYRGAVHFHCGKKDKLLPPQSCIYAYNAASNAAERKLFWHDRGHSMPKDEYINEALTFFSGKTVSAEHAQSSAQGPIHVLFVLHFDPKMEKGVMDMNSSATIQVYETSRDELVWLLDFAKKYGVKMTALFNGYYMQLALRRGELEPLERLLDEGHEIGTHAHNICYDKNKDWWFVCPGKPDIWFRDAKVAVDQVLKQLGKGENRVMCAMFERGKYGLEDELMKKYGYDIGLGNRPEIALGYFGHIVWNPWRARCSDDPRRALEEDESVSFISIDHRAQIGSTTSHGGVDSRSDTLKRQFLMLYVEWKTRELKGLGDKVWTWGVVHHPNMGDRYNSHIEDFFAWLTQHFIGKKTPSRNVIAVYSTASEVAEEFYQWEQSHPGESSFSYVEGQPYPYLCKYSRDLLLNATYAGELSLGADVEAFKFQSKNGEVFVLAWYNGKGTTTVDLSSLFSGKVKIYSGTGELLDTADSRSIPLTEQPVFILKD